MLNASFEPLHIVTWQKAIQLLFQGKVEVVEESEREIRTVSFSMKIPAVLRLLNYVPLKQTKTMIRFSRVNVFIRDRYTCQYCKRQMAKNQLTLDHVVPAVQGGRKSWENIVTACKPCNQRKGGRTPSEAGLTLARKPERPLWLPATHFELGVSLTPERWKIYFRLKAGDEEAEPES